LARKVLLARLAPCACAPPPTGVGALGHQFFQVDAVAAQFRFRRAAGGDVVVHADHAHRLAVASRKIIASAFR
jgi:hypothetical protein